MVCAGVASLPEVLGPAAAWCDEPTADQLSDRLAAVLTDRSLADELRSAGLARATTITWPEIAEQHLTSYERAVG